jgi:hypothetical protein
VAAVEHVKPRTADVGAADGETRLSARGWLLSFDWPRGAFHGPFKPETGCLLMEIYYFDSA